MASTITTTLSPASFSGEKRLQRRRSFLLRRTHPPSYRIPKPSNVFLAPNPLLTSTLPHKPQSSLTENPYDNLGTHLAETHSALRLAVLHQDLSLARSVHASAIKAQPHPFDDLGTPLANALISMYLKIGRLSNARMVFDAHRAPDVVSFTSLVSGYAKCGRATEAFELFCRMRELGIEPNEFSFVAILTSCIRSSNSHLGSQVHASAIKTHHSFCVYVANAIIGVYVKSWSFEDAVQVFDEMPERDVSSWNAHILGMVEDCRYGDAFETFRSMQRDGYRGDSFSLSTLLSAAAKGFAAEQGEVVHAYALKIGLEVELSVGNTLIGFYTRFGSVEDVVDLFRRMPVRDVISWTGMLTGYSEFGLVESAVQIFAQMPERNYISYNALLAGFCRNGDGSRGLELFLEIIEDGIEVSDSTLTSAVNACSMVSDTKKSKQIHAFVIKVGCESNARLEAALLDMCAKCGRMKDAKKMFERWTHEDSFSIAWTSLIYAHARNGQPDEALSLFHVMLQGDDMVIIDEYLLATVLGVCGTLGFGEMGHQLHCYVIKSGALSDLEVGNAVVSMYAKCWAMGVAISFFNQMPYHDIVSLNTLIAAYLLHRNGEGALSAWGSIQKLGLNPDPITFVLVISACRYTRSKSIDTCRKLFLSMTSSYNIEPSSEHHAAMIDVLGYWGCFSDAEKLINSMPFKPDALVWRALLDSCRLQSNLSLGRQAVQHLLALEPHDPSTYILVSNLYSASGRWHCSEKVREEMRRKGFRKNPARSWIIHQNAVHSFYARDGSHPQSKDITGGLKILILECLKAGYEPDTSFVLHEVEEFQKKDFLFHHSAKLAVAYGLLTADHGQAVRVVKNIHLCGDCHTFLKFVSSVTQREISVRDATGVHSFNSGGCSCRDFW